MKNTTFLSGFFLLTLLLIFAACPVDKKEVGQKESVLTFDQETFDAQRQLWREQDLKNYSFYLSSDFYAGQPYIWKGTVAVKDGALFGFIADDIAARGDFFDISNQFTGEWINSISGILDSIINDSQRPYKDERARRHRLTLEYDSEFHFPKRYSYDNSGFDPEVVGGGWDKSFTITKFTPAVEIAHNTLNFDRETFDAERELWLQRDVGGYSFRLRWDSFEEKIAGQGPVMCNIWEGAVAILSNGSYEAVSFNPPFHYNGKSDWAVPIADIFDRITSDSEKNYGLAWGCASQSTLELEYDSQYHFPARYRYHAEPLEPAGQEAPQMLYEITITNFAR